MKSLNGGLCFRVELPVRISAAAKSRRPRALFESSSRLSRHLYPTPTLSTRFVVVNGFEYRVSCESVGRKIVFALDFRSAASSLLDRVGQLMREQLATTLRSRAVLSFAEDDIVPSRVGQRIDRSSCYGGLVPEWIRTLLKSHPKRGSKKRRSQSCRGRPPPVGCLKPSPTASIPDLASPCNSSPDSEDIRRMFVAAATALSGSCMTCSAIRSASCS